MIMVISKSEAASQQQSSSNDEDEDENCGVTRQDVESAIYRVNVQRGCDMTIELLREEIGLVDLREGGRTKYTFWELLEALRVFWDLDEC